MAVLTAIAIVDSGISYLAMATDPRDNQRRIGAMNKYGLIDRGSDAGIS
jgi:hypothetical protein